MKNAVVHQQWQQPLLISFSLFLFSFMSFFFFVSLAVFSLFSMSRSFSVDATTQITFRFLSSPSLSKTFTHSITSYTHRAVTCCVVH
jgi:hypothetical protein